MSKVKCTGQRYVEPVSFPRSALKRPSETLSVSVGPTTQSIVASCGPHHLRLAATAWRSFSGWC
jgi:hypothetical protein